MPARLDSCVTQVMGQGHDESSAYAICRASLGLAEDGSEDEEEPKTPPEEEERRIEEEMQAHRLRNSPTFKKRMVVAKSIGRFVNGDQEGNLDAKRLQQIVDNTLKAKRQVPIYMLVGQPEELRQHPVDLDEKVADGWAESYRVLANGDLEVDAKLLGDAAVYVANDRVRGASIGTKQAKAADGTPIGEVLDHIVLTNSPFIKDLNIAASRQKGGERPVLFFTALEVKKMADKKDETKKATPVDLSMKEELEAAQSLIAELQGTVQTLSASNDNLKEELQARQKNTDLETALHENRKLQRRLDATKVRELIHLGLERGQFKHDTVKGYEGGDKRSDEITLAWFKNSIFGGDMEKLGFALETFPRHRVNRTFIHGAPEDGEPTLTSDDKAALKEFKVEPALVAKMRGVKSYSDFKRLKDELGLDKKD